MVHFMIHSFTSQKRWKKAGERTACFNYLFLNKQAKHGLLNESGERRNSMIFQRKQKVMQLSASIICTYKNVAATIQLRQAVSGILSMKTTSDDKMVNATR